MLASTLLSLAGLVFSAGAGAASLSVLVLDKEGKPAPDAVVVVVPSAKTGAPPKPLPEQVTIYQEKMRFVPAVSVVGLGAKAQFVNNDPWEHHEGKARGAVPGADAAEKLQRVRAVNAEIFTGARYARWRVAPAGGWCGRG